MTALGDILRASKDENADLFWGLQGGGGNFGRFVVEYRLHPVGTVISGLIAYPFERLATCSIFPRDHIAGLPTISQSLARCCTRPTAPSIAVMIACHCWPAERCRTAVQPIKKFGTPVYTIGPQPTRRRI